MQSSGIYPFRPIVLQERHYYPFGMLHAGYGKPARELYYDTKNRKIYSRQTAAGRYKYWYQEQERQTDLDLNWDSFKYRNYDYAIGRFMSVDPLAEKYPYNGVYNFSENRVIDGRELEGLETILITDINERPKDNGTRGETYTGQMYYRNDNTGEIYGPYEASTYPNSVSNTDNSTRYNTINAGEHHYNNYSGHHGGRSKGLNIDDLGQRRTYGTDPNGDPVIMQYVNVHAGASDNGNYNSRGSQGCITINPSDADAFFSNFNWTNESKTTGDASGTLIIVRGDETDRNIAITQFKIEALQIQFENMRLEMLTNEVTQKTNQLLNEMKEMLNTNNQ